MRVGIFADLRNPSQEVPWADFYAQALERYERADELGIDSIWFSEHHLFDDGYLPQPLTVAAAVAARTSRIAVCTGVVIAPLRPAVELAAGPSSGSRGAGRPAQRRFSNRRRAQLRASWRRRRHWRSRPRSSALSPLACPPY